MVHIYDSEAMHTHSLQRRLIVCTTLTITITYARTHEKSISRAIPTSFRNYIQIYFVPFIFNIMHDVYNIICCLQYHYRSDLVYTFIYVLVFSPLYMLYLIVLHMWDVYTYNIWFMEVRIRIYLLSIPWRCFRMRIIKNNKENKWFFVTLQADNIISLQYVWCVRCIRQ